MAPPLMLVGAGISAAGSIMAGEAAMAAGRYSKNIAERNATILDNKADQSIALGELNVKKFDKLFATQQASTEAAYIAAGVKMSGTPMEIMEYNIAEAELEKMIADYLKKGGTIKKLPPALAKGMKPSDMKAYEIGKMGVVKSMKMKEVREFVDLYNRHFLLNYKAEELVNNEI